MKFLLFYSFYKTLFLFCGLRASPPCRNFLVFIPVYFLHILLKGEKMPQSHRPSLLKEKNNISLELTSLCDRGQSFYITLYGLILKGQFLFWPSPDHQLLELLRKFVVQISGPQIHLLVYLFLNLNKITNQKCLQT